MLSVRAQVKDHLPSHIPEANWPSLPPSTEISGHLRVGWDFMTPSPIHTAILSGLISHGSCSCVVAIVSSHVQYSSHAQQILFHCIHPQPPALKIFLPPLPWWALSPGHGCDMDAPLRDEHSIVSVSWPVVDIYYCKPKNSLGISIIVNLKILWEYITLEWNIEERMPRPCCLK